MNHRDRCGDSGGIELSLSYTSCQHWMRFLLSSVFPMQGVMHQSTWKPPLHMTDCWHRTMPSLLNSWQLQLRCRRCHRLFSASTCGSSTQRYLCHRLGNPPAA